MKSILWIWLIFTLLFAGLSCFHFIQSSKKIAPFKLTEKTPGGTIKFFGVDKDESLNEFIGSVNSFVDDLNKNNSKQNRLSGVGYLFASLVSIFSMVLAIKGKA